MEGVRSPRFHGRQTETLNTLRFIASTGWAWDPKQGLLKHVVCTFTHGAIQHSGSWVGGRDVLVAV